MSSELYFVFINIIKKTHHFQINKSDEFFYYNSGKISGKESTDLSDESIAIIYFLDNFA